MRLLTLCPLALGGSSSASSNSFPRQPFSDKLKVYAGREGVHRYLHVETPEGRNIRFEVFADMGYIEGRHRYGFSEEFCGETDKTLDEIREWSMSNHFTLQDYGLIERNCQVYLTQIILWMGLSPSTCLLRSVTFGTSADAHGVITYGGQDEYATIGGAIVGRAEAHAGFVSATAQGPSVGYAARWGTQHGGPLGGAGYACEAGRADVSLGPATVGVKADVGSAIGDMGNGIYGAKAVGFGIGAGPGGFTISLPFFDINIR